MGSQRAEDERDGAGVGLDEADVLRGGRFVGDEVVGGGVAGGVGGGVGARTAARAGTTTEVASDPASGTDSPVETQVDGTSEADAAVSPMPTPSVPAAASEPGSAPDPDKASAAEPADLTDSQIVGRRLALARQHAGLSIEEVVAATRIRPGMLREIEAGEFVHCGGDVYARGHVRAIAKVVGIDPEPLLEEHPPFVPTDLPVRGRSRVVPRVEAPKAPAAAAEEPKADSDKRASMPASNAVPTSAARDNAARFAGRAPSRVIRPAAEGATLSVATRGSGSGTAAGSAAAGGKGAGSGSFRPPQPRRKDDPGKIERHPKSANWTAAMLVALLGLVVFAGVQLVGDGGSGKAAPAAAPAPPPKAVALKPPPPPAPPAPPKGVAVRIAAVGSDSWLNVTGPDGHVLFDNMLPAGSTQSFQDPKQLGVTLGNAAAVHMLLNGKDVGSAGGSGQVVHVTLKPTGMVDG